MSLKNRMGTEVQRGDVGPVEDGEDAEDAEDGALSRAAGGFSVGGGRAEEQLHQDRSRHHDCSVK